MHGVGFEHMTPVSLCIEFCGVVDDIGKQDLVDGTTEANVGVQIVALSALISIISTHHRKHR